jgi:hypothetical protein
VRSIPNCRKCRKGTIRKQSSATRPRRMISRRGSPALKGSAIDQHRMRAAALSWTAAQLFGLSLVGHPGRSLRASVLSTVGRVVAAEVDPIRYADRLAFCRGLGLGGQWLPRTGHAGVRGIGRGAMRDLDRVRHRSVGGVSERAVRLDAARGGRRRGACGNRAPARATGGVGLGRAQTSSFEKPRTRWQEHYFSGIGLRHLRQLRHFPARSPEPSQVSPLSQGRTGNLRLLRP